MTMYKDEGDRMTAVTDASEATHTDDVVELKLNLSMDSSTNASKRVKAAVKRKAAVKYEPTWDEVWRTGWTSHTGAAKPPIVNSKTSDSDKVKLLDVKEAIDNGELGTFVESLREFTKAHALRLHSSLMQSRKSHILAKMVNDLPPNYLLIQDEKSLEKLCWDLSKESVIGFDTETTGLDMFGSDVVVGMSFTLPKADYHVYIPVAHSVADRQLSRDYVFDKVGVILRDEHIEKVLHNARFDYHMCAKHGVKMRGKIHDTRVTMALLNENEPSYSLKNLATKYGRFFGFEGDSHTFSQLFGKTLFSDVPLDVALVYAAKDTHLTYKLFKWHVEQLEKRPSLYNLYHTIEQPIIDVVIEMEQSGFVIDSDFAEVYGRELKQELSDIEKELLSAWGDINFNSPMQLAQKLYDELKLPEVDGRSTDAKTLKQLKGHFHGIAPLLKHRELSKLLGTYVEALPARIKPDGRVHGSFHQVQTVTGRFSSSDPNLQNLPPRARKLIIAPDGKVIGGSDFSQIEPRVLAHMAKVSGMIEAYMAGRDLYSEMASKIFRVPVEECGDGTKYRKATKVILLAIMYGIGIPALAEQIGCTQEEAIQYISDFYVAFPEIKTFIHETWEFVKQNEFVETMLGRKRRFPHHKQDAIEYDKAAREICDILGVSEVPMNFWKYDELPYKLKRRFQNVKGKVERVRRMAVNARIQGTAADVMKLAMIRVYKYLKANGWNLLATIHDELLYLVDDTVTERQIERIEECMTGAVELCIPMKVDTELMTRWGDGVPKKQFFGGAA